MRRFLPLLALTAAAAVAAACTAADVTISENFEMVALVYGRVQTVVGEPIPDALITLEHSFPACGSERVEYFTATTDSVGRFRKFVVAGIENAGCIRVKGAAAGFSADSTDLPRVTFDLVAVDSLEANLVLRRP
jgi:hypothetical protein